MDRTEASGFSCTGFSADCTHTFVDPFTVVEEQWLSDKLGHLFTVRNIVYIMAQHTPTHIKPCK